MSESPFDAFLSFLISTQRATFVLSSPRSDYDADVRKYFLLGLRLLLSSCGSILSHDVTVSWFCCHVHVGWPVVVRVARFGRNTWQGEDGRDEDAVTAFQGEPSPPPTDTTQLNFLRNHLAIRRRPVPPPPSLVTHRLVISCMIMCALQVYWTFQNTRWMSKHTETSRLTSGATPPCRHSTTRCSRTSP